MTRSNRRRVVTAVIPVTAAVSGAAAAWLLGRRRHAMGHNGGLLSGRAARNAEVARMASRVGRTYALSSARQIFASAERKEELKAEQQLKSAAEVVEALGSMKGALMKLGQMASYLDTGLPEPMRQALAGLQQDAPPMSPELAAGVVADEFGLPPDRLFAEWDPVPIAAASIGQVHRAMTHDGVAVAVKVQYPGVDDAIRSDLDNSALLVQIVGMVFPGLEAEPVLEELRARLTEELDYRLEADNQQRFAEGFAGHPFIHVPAVRADLSSRRVLTTELATGARYDDVVGWPDEERNMAAEAIFRFVFGSLYRYHAFNGDPHPGNYLFNPGGRVTFLDFGLVKWFTPREVELLAEMVDAMVMRHDPHGFRVAVEAAGFLKPDPSLTDEMVAATLSHYYELVLERGVSTCTPEYATETVRRFFDAGDEVVKRANVPPAFVVLQRINLGLYAVLAGIRATADWRRIAEEIWPWVDAEPSTELGRQEAAWRSAAPRTFRARP
ncbi:MAG: AarF/ABC1/UbiB kinase family protein [Actinomycetota bacterium]|nr:AarF/ABC1/UbiB kinase family protein [Actinomycetota bacterium]